MVREINYISNRSRGVKYFWFNIELFTLIDNVLIRIKTESTGYELVITESSQQQAMQWNHDIPSPGHQGIARTKAKLKEKILWFH